MSKNDFQKKLKEIGLSPKEIYVDPPLNITQENAYLKLLYKNIDYDVKSLTKIKYINLFFNSFLNNSFIVHHHWFQTESKKSIFTLMWKIVWIFLLRIRGIEIIWTIHNKEPHNKKYVIINKILRRIFAKTVTHIHVHCNYAKNEMSSYLDIKKDKFFVVKHPNYEVIRYSRREAIEKFQVAYPSINLNLNKKIFLVFGQMAKYKGIKELLEFTSKIDENFTIIFAGKIKDGNKNYVDTLKNYESKKNIFINEYISDENLSMLFNLSDCVLFNYQDILTSGGVVLALNYNKYTIAPNKACIGEIEDSNLHLYNSDSELSDEILKVLNENITI